jgi:hypothetical protein
MSRRRNNQDTDRIAYNELSKIAQQFVNTAAKYGISAMVTFHLPNMYGTRVFETSDMKCITGAIIDSNFWPYVKACQRLAKELNLRIGSGEDSIYYHHMLVDWDIDKRLLTGGDPAVDKILSGLSYLPLRALRKFAQMAYKIKWPTIGKKGRKGKNANEGKLYFCFCFFPLIG